MLKAQPPRQQGPLRYGPCGPYVLTERSYMEDEVHIFPVESRYMSWEPRNIDPKAKPISQEPNPKTLYSKTQSQTYFPRAQSPTWIP